jgi:hypothetical protein
MANEPLGAIEEHFGQVSDPRYLFSVKNQKLNRVKPPKNGGRTTLNKKG